MNLEQLFCLLARAAIYGHHYQCVSLARIAFNKAEREGHAYLAARLKPILDAYDRNPEVRLSEDWGWHEPPPLVMSEAKEPVVEFIVDSQFPEDVPLVWKR